METGTWICTWRGTPISRGTMYCIPIRTGCGGLTTDYDNDGWIDIYVANDSNPNFLFHNLGKGRFEEVGIASSAGVNAEGRAQAGMGVDAGDYDGDGLTDIVGSGVF